MVGSAGEQQIGHFMQFLLRSRAKVSADTIPKEEQAFHRRPVCERVLGLVVRAGFADRVRCVVQCRG